MGAIDYNQDFDLAGASSGGGSDQADFRKRLQADSGRLDSLRRAILNMVTEERYDSAISELKTYSNFRTEYPDFKPRTERHIQHCIDLVLAIKAKRSLPGLSRLSAAKQKELHDMALHHFDELTHFLKQIEKVEVDVKLADVRSTVWFLQTCVYCMLALFVGTLFVDMTSGFFTGGIVYMDDLLSRAAAFIFGLVGM